MTENEILKSALEKVKAQKVNFGFLERFDVDENWEVMKALEEIQAYRAIGTVEELKALKEKSVAKKSNEMQPTNKLTSGYFSCPICESVVGIEDMQDNYCPNCGQKLDWE